jgi:hypothetical protein
MGQFDLTNSRTVFGVPVDTSGLSYTLFENGVSGLLVTGKDTGADFAIRAIGSKGIIEVPGCDNSDVRVFSNGAQADESGWETIKIDNSARYLGSMYSDSTSIRLSK